MSTDDSPERTFDAYDIAGLPSTTLEDVEDTSNLCEDEVISNPSNSTEKPDSTSRTPRREVWWVDLGRTNQTVESIKRSFEDCLDRFFVLSSFNSLLHRIRSHMWNFHQCPGYLREEITLTSDVSRSAIISHAFPSESELCSMCGQLVTASSPNRDQNTSYRHSSSVPHVQSPNRSKHRPSSLRTLTRALKLAREAVQIDSTNDDPVAAVSAYAQTVSLLNEVMERVENGGDSTGSHAGISAREREVERLKNIVS
jgi:hypothetical protein